ncbi:hypothetical protein [Pontibacillus salipaludis]|uniref:hypothetical protein n=1 Tax=Pontibacillus salipaludis TaxID=1697394 RepID=UPI0031EF6161
MNPDICELISQNAKVFCVLTDENGIPNDPTNSGSIVCEEIPGSRKDVLVNLESGEEILLQEIALTKKGFVVIEIEGEEGVCISNPIPFTLYEELILCAPEGTSIDCEITRFNCQARVICQNGEFVSVKLWIETCQSIQTKLETSFELNARFCSPRPLIRSSKEKMSFNTSNSNSNQNQMKPHCIRTNKVYDYVNIRNTTELTVGAEDIDFICSPCEVALFVPADIVCSRNLTGIVTCGGAPIEGVEVLFTSPSGSITFTPNPVLTDENGNFSTVATVDPGTNEPTTITATANIDGMDYSSTLPTIIQCPVEECLLEVFAPEAIDCDGIIEGVVRCGGELIEGAEVNLASDNVNVTLNPDTIFTDSNGEFFTGISVEPGTTDTVQITINTVADGQPLMEVIEIDVDCPAGTCVITLEVPTLIDCSGTLTGTVTCDGVPQAGVQVFFSDFPEDVTITPNPAITLGDGTFEADITVAEGSDLTAVIIIATAPSLGVSAEVGTDVICLPVEECPCKFRIGIQGNSAPATVEVVNNGVPDILTGDINVSAVQCFIAGPGCNPNVDNFNITFGSNGTNINFILGRRITISCEDGNVARVFGTAEAQGLFSGIFEVWIEVTMGPGNLGTWVVQADDVFGNSFNTTFVAPMSPTTFIGDCE